MRDYSVCKSVLLVGLLLLNGCGNDFAGFVPLTPLGKNYDGIWLTGCVRDYAGRGRGASFARVYDGERFTSQIRNYSSAGCLANTERSTVTLTGTFVVGGEIMGNVDDARELNLSVESLTLALHDYDTLFDAIDLDTKDDWMLGKPVEVRSYLGDACADDDDCLHAICDIDTSTCTRRDSAGTNGWRDLLELYGLPELQVGDLVYDIIALDLREDEETAVFRDVLFTGDLNNRWADFEYARPIASSSLPFVRRSDDVALAVEIPAWFHGDWLLAAERLTISAQEVEVIGMEPSGELQVLAPYYTREPNVFELRQTSAAGALVYDVYFLYLGAGAEGLLAKLGSSALTASDDPEGPFLESP